MADPVRTADPASPAARSLAQAQRLALRRLRLAVLAAGAAGQLAVAATGGLPLALLPVVLALLVGLDALSATAGAARSALLQRVATGGVAVVAALTLVGVAQTSGAGLRDVLAPALLALQVLQALTPRRRRELQTGLLVAGALLVVAASAGPDPVAGLALVAGWAASLAALALLVQARGLEPLHVLVRPPGREPVLATVALGLALGLVAFLLVPAPPPGGRTPTAVGQSGGERTGTGSARAQGLSAADTVDLRARGELSERPLLVVPDDSPQHWRSAAFTTWDGRAWSNDRARPARLTGPPYRVSAGPGPTRTDAVRLLDGGGQVWSPGEPRSVQGLAGLATDGVAGLRTPVRNGDYLVTSLLRADTAALQAATGPGDTDPRWRQLPDALPERVRALGLELTAGAATRYEAVTAVEQWLRTHATYRLDSPVPGPGEDAVDRFLFVDRTGFCEQFAAAEVLLLRAAGIPARFVTGAINGAVGPAGRTYRERDLHAYVEVSYEGLGWQLSDPTAGSALAGRSAREQLADTLGSALEALDRAPGGRAGAAALLAALVALGAGLVALARRRPARPVAAPQPDPGATRPALAAFLRLDARLGAARRQPPESLGELAARLRLHPEGARAVEVVQRECYAAEPPDPADAVAVLDALARS